MKTVFSMRNSRVVDCAKGHPSRRRIASALRRAAESKGVTLLIGPYKTGKSSLIRQALPEGMVLDPYENDHMEKLVRISRGREDVGDLVVIDEAYPIIRFGGATLILRLAERTKVVAVAHPKLLDRLDPTHRDILQGLNGLDHELVINPFWTDELMLKVCLEVLKLTPEEAREFVWFSGGSPEIIECISEPNGSRTRKELDLSRALISWIKHYDRASARIRGALTRIARNGNSIDGNILDILRRSGYLGEDGKIRSGSLEAYLSGIEKAREQIQAFRLRN